MIDTNRFVDMVPRDVFYICRTLRMGGWRAWIVGGCTRDMIIGRSVNDWDIATDARPVDVISTFRRVIQTGVRHGTVTVLLNGTGYEVTTLRGDGTYSDGRHPDEVVFVDNLVLDLARRDFTINAIAFDPLDRVITDPFGGCSDLDAKLIRAVGVPRERYREDGLRLMRAARFASMLQFDLENVTAVSIAECADRLACVSSERIRDELFKLLVGRDASRGLRIMQKGRMLEYVLPEAIASIGCTQCRYHAYDVWEHTLHAVDACRSDLVLRLTLLLHDLGKPVSRRWRDTDGTGGGDYTFHGHEVDGAEIADRVGERLRFCGELRKRVVHLVRHHMLSCESNWTHRAVRRWVQRVGKENVIDLLEIARADAVGTGVDVVGRLRLLDELSERLRLLDVGSMALTVGDLVIGGDDLMSVLGLQRGRVVGKLLKHLLELVVDDPEMNERERLLRAARRYLEVEQSVLTDESKNVSD